MKILSSKQTKEADLKTIERQQISSWTLMERAATALTKSLLSDFPQSSFCILAGMGNNGGDGLALARLLHYAGRKVVVYRLRHSASASADNRLNWRLLQRLPIRLIETEDSTTFHKLPCPPEMVVVDGLLGAGLNRPLEGLLAEVVDQVVNWAPRSVAIDIPTGLFADGNQKNDLSRVWPCQITYTFQHPKLSLVHSETASKAGNIRVLDIGLDQDFYQTAEVYQYFLQKEDLQQVYRAVPSFSYKNKRGHALLLAGSAAKAGACHLAASGALSSGLGLCTALVPKSLATALNQSWPELMLRFRDAPSLAQDRESYDTLLIGPGMGLDREVWQLAKQEIASSHAPVIMDADALRHLAEDKVWLQALDREVVLTPHPGEWAALCKGEEESNDLLEAYRRFAKEYQVYLLIKSKVSILTFPNGQQFFSDFGHPSLAKGGSGDVLAGIIAACLAQGYQTGAAVQLALYLHGRAAQHGAAQESTESLRSGQLHAYIGKAFKELGQEV